MQIIRTFESLAPYSKPVVLAAGFFDGVHLGHQEVLLGAVEHARRVGAEAWALSFDCHPREIIDKNGAPALITPLNARQELLSKTGLDGLCLIKFDIDEAQKSPEAFIGDILKIFPKLIEIRCGANWRFGAKASGSPQLLQEMGQELGFSLSIAKDMLFNGAPISSTRIRKAIANGELEDVTQMLGRPYSITEIVVDGRQVGSANGIATANFQPTTALLPQIGVYIVESVIDGMQVRGVADLGWRPTFADARPEMPVLEVHYLDFEGNLYGKALTISFLKRLRDEITFATPDALFEQIRKDITAARLFAPPPIEGNGRLKPAPTMMA